MTTSVALLGSTGSIGTQTLDVVRSAPDDFQIVALAAHRDVEAVVAQAREFRPAVVALSDPSAAAELKEHLPAGVELEAGPDALAALAATGDVVVNAVVGFAGLPVTLSALGSGRRLALANKESLIAAGPVTQPLREIPGAEIVPVDSEHCAIHQCLRAGEGARYLDSIVLTASGGPFRGRSADELRHVTIDDALAHPTWSMGPKITIDSSTLMNKGLEVIEAHELFGVDYDSIEVVVHPQSIVHSMATFTDGATIAQLSLPDMRLPIAYALRHPERHRTGFGRLDFSTAMSLDFEPPDRDAFRCLGLAFDAGRAGGTAPAWLSAANEVAVEAFLAGRIAWASIAEIAARALDAWDGTPAGSVDAVLAADAASRRHTTQILDRFHLDSPHTDGAAQHAATGAN
ncbi:MAG TPA: 1-deoxy-D-xylulose-5-phosphate reductoisomerase [Microthrixaceae bacterium]|nr:1-deoxy-D-xylulose-5-phosphate reductoisomerase [Microthrixaceae bacterium]